MPDIDEFNRLVQRGLPHSVVSAVMRGDIDEATAVASANEASDVRKWCKVRKNIPETLEPSWDLDPANFYLAHDGVNPADCDPRDYALIEADLAEVRDKLIPGARRDRDPWHQTYKSKSCGTAYRWVNGKAVTPPLLGHHGSAILIRGGMHRFYLADHYRAVRMPFLVQKTDLKGLIELLVSATPTPQG